MATLSPERIGTLLGPFLANSFDAGNSPQIYDKERLIACIGEYLDLLIKWNSRTNLTAIREPEEIVRRHFGESLFCGAALRHRFPDAVELLDFGSGAGFPGLPIQILLPAWRVTLAESQGKKAAFLREAVRTLGVPTEVWGNRVEAMPDGKTFDCITLRAVDNMEMAVRAAKDRVKRGGLLAVLAGATVPGELAGWSGTSIHIPDSETRHLHLLTAPL